MGQEKISRSKIRFILLVLTYFLQDNSSAQHVYTSHKFSVVELKQDIQYMKTKMERYNVNLYEYSSKSEMDSIFQTLRDGISNNMTAQDFYNYICRIQPLVKDGHNYLLPSKEYQNYCSAKELYFPLDFAIDDNKLFLKQNFSNDSTLSLGSEIVSINGAKAIDVFNYLVDHQVRDGSNLNYPNFLSQIYFRSYYGFLFGFCKSFKLELRSNIGNSITKVIDALPLDTIKERRKNGIPQRFDRINHDKAISWSFHKDKNFTYLNIRDWSSKNVKSDYNQNIKSEFKKFINELKKNETGKLIIDLRGNQGGDGMNGIYLMRHLLDKPFHYFYSVKSLGFRHRLHNSGFLLTKKYKPKGYVFKNKIIVLTNGGTFSNSSAFASILHSLNRATIIGTETGGNAKTMSGGIGFFEFPNTKINLLKVTAQMIITNKIDKTERGVLPDLKIEPTLKNLIENYDEVLEYAIETN